jgi:hypothetical protein
LVRYSQLNPGLGRYESIGSPGCPVHLHGGLLDRRREGLVPAKSLASSVLAVRAVAVPDAVAGRGRIVTLALAVAVPLALAVAVVRAVPVAVPVSVALARLVGVALARLVGLGIVGVAAARTATTGVVGTTVVAGAVVVSPTVVGMIRFV